MSVTSTVALEAAERPPISAVVVNYNGRASLERTLASLAACTPPFAEIIVVDDGSTDGSPEWVAAHYPQIVLVRFAKNTANLGKVRNAGLARATSRYVFLTDNDVQLLPDTIDRLLATLTGTPDVLCVSPRLLDHRDPSIIRQDGNGLHFLCLSTGSIRAARKSDVPAKAPFANIGGGIMLLDLDRARTLGMFDEGYTHGWADDGELHVRATLFGYRCLQDSRAECLLEVREHGTERAFGQLYNRLRLLSICYEAGTLAGFAPALLLFELALLSGAIFGGFSRAYVRAWRAAWRDRANIAAARRRVQSTRKLRDRDLLRRGRFELPVGLSSRWKLHLISMARYVFDINWFFFALFGWTARTRADTTD